MTQPTLRDLQWFQTRHNKEYHHDINVLTKANKISHHIHHISKYAHGITDTFHEDMMANALSIFNALNFSIGKLPCSPFIYGTAEDGYYISVNTSDVIPDLGTAVSGLCKAIEAFDHLEAIDYRGEFIKHTGNILHYVIRKNPNILEEYLLRLTKIQRAHIFDDNIREDIEAHNRRVQSKFFCFFEYNKKFDSLVEVKHA